MQLKRAARVILIGAPGVGKGTQSDRLLQRFPQLQSISTGDLLRRNVRNKTPLGKDIHTHLDVIEYADVYAKASESNQS